MKLCVTRLLVSAVDGDVVGVGLEEGVEVGERRLAAAAPFEEPALAARREDLKTKVQISCMFMPDGSINYFEYH